MFKIVSYALLVLFLMAAILDTFIQIWIDNSTNNYGENRVDNWPYKKLRANHKLSTKQEFLLGLTIFIKYTLGVTFVFWSVLYWNR
jgi:hypothetical protein